MNKNKSDKYKYGEESNLNVKLIVALHRSMQPQEKGLTSLLACHNLTISQFGVLESLYHIGAMNINQIIEKTLSTSGNMTVVIKNLVKQGLVTKNRDPEDGRAFLIHLTDKGLSTISEVFPAHLFVLKEEFSSLEIDEKKELLRLLKKLNRYNSET